MIIGVPKEIKNNENRVALTPAGVESLSQAGHKVLIQTGAGSGSGFTDQEYIEVGAGLMSTAADVFGAADMIIKVKEPLPAEYNLFKLGQILFTYLHLAPEPELTAALLRRKVIGIAYETVQPPDGTLPLLTPMSEVAGRMAVQIGARLLEKPCGGKGILMGGVPGVLPAKVTIVGAGIVGANSAKIAIGMGADVTILDISPARLYHLDEVFGTRIKTLISNSYNLKLTVAETDLLIGAVLIPGAKAPKLVTEDMVKSMKPGSVIVDVAIDQGGSIASVDRVTTHSDPTFVKHGVVHYSVANIPGAVARTSTHALTNATLPYALRLANLGYAEAIRTDLGLARGVNVIHGKLTYKAVADSLNLTYTPLGEVTAVPPGF